MTIHKSKGLEFDNVYALEIEEVCEDEEEDDKIEFRNLKYV